MKWNDMCMNRWMDERFDIMIAETKKKDNPITEWVIALMNEQTIEWLNEWINNQMNKRMNFEWKNI